MRHIHIVNTKKMLPIVFILLFIGLTFIPPILGMYSPMYSVFYGMLPEGSRSGNQPQMGPVQYFVFVGGRVYFGDLPAENAKVRIYGTDDVMVNVIHTDAQGFFNSTSMFRSGQVVSIMVNDIFLWNIFVPYNVNGYFDIGTVRLFL
jgi:hypothetical protein